MTSHKTTIGDEVLAPGLPVGTGNGGSHRVPMANSAETDQGLAEARTSQQSPICLLDACQSLPFAILMFPLRSLRRPRLHPGLAVTPRTLSSGLLGRLASLHQLIFTLTAPITHPRALKLAYLSILPRRPRRETTSPNPPTLGAILGTRLHPGPQAPARGTKV
ncbi:hypothetical protein FZEAL_9119 [Fusarium zealandicum]|uniref:Uncharacterized protein n=1 Tax=Fusarium zealandicum TaxID=1053134 RepID=A0A8H4UCK0_9HYPO|nr:hypothetical protein FZEAL_9119 [Fusarium zealandicum]